MTEYVVHIKRHCGWHTTTAEGDSFPEAAVAAVIDTCKRYGLDLDNIPHTAEYLDDVIPDSFSGTFRHRRVLFRWAAPHRVFDPILHGGWGVTKPGDYWFSERVREGQEGDCRACGGTGVDFYNPFKTCRMCSGHEDRFVAEVRGSSGDER